MKKKFTETEWFGVTKIAKPGISKQEFAVLWANFLKFKGLSKPEQAAFLNAM